MIVDKNFVAQIAKLANIEVREEELVLFSQQLGSILHYIEKLKEVKEQADPFSFGAQSPSTLREDKALPGIPTEEALQNAPQKYKTFFKVPKVLP